MKDVTLIAILFLIVGCSNLTKQQANQENQPIAFDVNYIDSTTNPCENFYKYAIGNWQTKNTVHETESRWIAFNILN